MYSQAHRPTQMATDRAIAKLLKSHVQKLVEPCAACDIVRGVQHNVVGKCLQSRLAKLAPQYVCQFFDIFLSIYRV